MKISSFSSFFSLPTIALAAVSALGAADDPFIAFAEGDLIAARSGAKAILAQDPSNPEANVLLGFVELLSAATDPAAKAVMANLGVDLTVDPSALTEIGVEYRREWSTEAAWTYVANVPELGGDAVRSGKSVGSRGSVLSAEFEGPGLVTFRYLLEYGESSATPPGLLYYNWEVDQVDAFLILDRLFDLEDVTWFWGGSELARDGAFYVPAGKHTVYWGLRSGPDSSLTGAALYLSDLAFVPENGEGSSLGSPVGNGTLEDGLDAAVLGLTTGFTDHPTVAAPLTPNGVLNYFRRDLRPRLEAAETAFKAIGDADFAVSLTFPPIGGLGQTLRIDAADVLYVRGLMVWMLGFSETFAQIDLGDQSLLAVEVRQTMELSSLASWLSEDATLFARSGVGDLVFAATSLNRARDLLYAAERKSAQRTEIADRDALIRRQQYPGAPNDEWGSDPLGDFISALPETGSVVDWKFSPDDGDSDADRIEVRLAPLFSGHWIPRSFLPVFEGNTIALGSGTNGSTFPDTTFGGVLQGLSQADMREGAAEDGIGWWSFDRWKTIPGNAGATLEDYAKPRDGEIETGFYRWSNGLSFWYNQNLDQAPARGDLIWDAEIADASLQWVSYQTWATSHEEFDVSFYRSDWFHQFYANYQGNPLEIPMVFARFSADLLPPISDWNGWEFEFRSQWSEATEPISRLRVSSGNQVTMSFPSGGAGADLQKGPFPATFEREGPYLRIRWFDAAGYHHLLKMDLRGSGEDVLYRRSEGFVAKHPGETALVDEWIDWYPELGTITHWGEIETIDFEAKRVVINN